jgi:hypothetical protein
MFEEQRCFLPQHFKVFVKIIYDLFSPDRSKYPARRRRADTAVPNIREQEIAPTIINFFLLPKQKSIADDSSFGASFQLGAI